MRPQEFTIGGIAALVSLLFLSVTASAQTTGASGIAGAVTDTSGGVLPGVTVEASSPVLIEKVRRAVTDGQGRYTIVDLRPGSYTVTFSLDGFNTLRREGIELSINFTATVNAELRVGSLEETLTVTGASPVVDVQNTAQRNVLSRSVLDSVPTGARWLPSFVALTPGLTTSAGMLDVGGTRGDNHVTASIHGSRQNETRIVQDGFETNAPSGGGMGRVYNPNPGSAQEVLLELGGGSAELQTGGVRWNFIPKDGGNIFSGDIFTSFSNDAMQGTNVTDTVRARGLNENSINKLDVMWDVNSSLGGPIKRDKLWFFTSHHIWATDTLAAGGFHNATPESWFYTPDFSRQGVRDFDGRHHTIRATWQASEKNRFRFSYDWQDRCDCHRNVGATTAPESAIRVDYRPNDMFQTTWTYPISNRLLIDAGATAQVIDHNETRFAEPFVTADLIRVTELSNTLPFRNITYRSAIYGENFSRHLDTRSSVSYVTGSHNFKAGLQTHFTYYRKGTQLNQDVSYTFRNGRPTQISLQIPTTFRETMKPNLGLYAQDQWAIRRLTLNMGLRFDYLNVFVPEQHLPANRLVGARDFGPVDCVPCWSDLSPRLSGSYDLFGNAKTAIKASLGRYVNFSNLDLARANNPLQTTVNSATRAWNDANGDFVPQEAELGPLNPSTFGQQLVRTRYADDLTSGFGTREYNWQASASIQHEVWPNASINVGYFRTAWYNFSVTDNLLTTPADFNEYCITTPVHAQLPGGGGQQICGLYDITEAKFGQSNFLAVKADNFGEQTEIYNGVDVTFNARLPRGATVGGGLSTGRTATNSCFVVDSPGALRFCEVVEPFQTQVKFNGSYTLPWDLQLSGVFQTLPGIPLTASYVATNAEIRPSLGRNLAGRVSAVLINNLIEPRTMFEGRINQLDLRMTKIFRMQRGLRLKTMFDLYNALNESPILSINDRVSASWPAATSILDARLFKVGVQLEF